MSTEEMLLAKLERLPQHERERLLRELDEWIEQNVMLRSDDVQRALAAVESTWASLSLDRATLRWIAEDTELEYDLG